MNNSQFGRWNIVVGVFPAHTLLTLITWSNIKAELWKFSPSKQWPPEELHWTDLTRLSSAVSGHAYFGWFAKYFMMEKIEMEDIPAKRHQWWVCLIRAENEIFNYMVKFRFLDWIHWEKNLWIRYKHDFLLKIWKMIIFSLSSSQSQCTQGPITHSSWMQQTTLKIL